jgi:hypothetical protein
MQGFLWFASGTFIALAFWASRHVGVLKVSVHIQPVITIADAQVGFICSKMTKCVVSQSEQIFIE